MNDARESSRHLADLLRSEHMALADFLVALSEFDRTGAFRRLGFANVFDYLRRELGLSRAAAHYRKVAARLVAGFPEVLEPLRDGRLCLTSVVELARVMTREDRSAVLPRFFGCSKQEAREVAVEIRPAAVVPRRTVAREVPLVPSLEATSVDAAVDEGSVRPGELEVRRHELTRTVVEPLTPELRRFHVTVSKVFLEKLKRAKAGQSHVLPGATDEQVMQAALDLLIAQQEKRKASVPARVKRAVNVRDQGKCQWALASGGICGSDVRAEIDHVVPRGKGGPSTVENCRVLCKAHNLQAARDVYGDAHMDLFPARVPVVREPSPAHGGVATWSRFDTRHGASMLSAWPLSPRSPRRSGSPGPRASASTPRSGSPAWPGGSAG